MKPNINEDAHRKFLKRVTSKCCRMEAATRISRLRGEGRF